MSQVTVDDQDSAVVYSGSWQHLPSTPGVTPAEYDHTKSGTADAGSTATLRFTGTQVSVFGSQGSIDVYGQPVTTYAIDGQVVATYQVPVIPPGYFTAGTTFFSSGTLSAGDHTLVVTNINGTKPNVLWLDGFRYTPSEAAPSSPAAPPSSPSAPSSPSQATSSPSAAPISNSPSSPSSSATPAQQQQQSSSVALTAQPQVSQSQSLSNSGFANQPTLFASGSMISSGSGTASSFVSTSSGGAKEPLSVSGSSASSSKAPVGAIVGGVLGGLAILSAAFLIFIILRRKSSRKPPDEADITFPPPDMRSVQPDPDPFQVRPFGSWRKEQEAPYTGASGNGKRNITPPATSSSENPFADSSSPQWESSPSESTAPQSTDPPSSVTPSEPLLPSNDQAQSPTPIDSEKSQIRSGVRRLPPTPGQGSVAIASAPAVVASTLSPPPAPSEDGGPLLGSVSPIVRHHEDSGLRLGARVVDVPPAYTRA